MRGIAPKRIRNFMHGEGTEYRHGVGDTLQFFAGVHNRAEVIFFH